MLLSDEYVAAALVRQGMIPSAPFQPSYAVSTRVLELYRNLRCRCPHLTGHTFVKGLVDMQGVRCQLSIKTNTNNIPVAL